MHIKIKYIIALLIILTYSLLIDSYIKKLTYSESLPIPQFVFIALVIWMICQLTISFIALTRIIIFKSMLANEIETIGIAKMLWQGIFSSQQSNYATVIFTALFGYIYGYIGHWIGFVFIYILLYLWISMRARARVF